MAHWLIKTEPNDYSFDDLVREGRAEWNGVRNNTALIHLRAMKKGDRVLIYHTGKERRAVGVGEVVRPAYPDPGAEHERFVQVDVRAVEPLPVPVTLADMKANPKLEGFELFRMSRLSVVPVTARQWREILRMSR